MLLLTFTAVANRYALDVTRVIEVVPRVKLRPIPHAPAFLAGLLDYRGNIVPVIDLGLLLGAAPCQDRLSTRIILVDSSPGDDENIEHQRDDGPDNQTGAKRTAHNPVPNLLGLIAEYVSDLTYIQPEQIVASPILLPQASYLGSMIRTEAGIVQLMMPERIRQASLERTYLGQAMELKESPQPSPLSN